MTLGDHVSAKKYLKQSYEIYKNINQEDSNGVARIKNNLASINLVYWEYAKAEDNLTDVVVGFDKNVKYVGADGQEVFELTPKYRSVPTNILIIFNDQV